MKKLHAFTLVELLVVMSIITILAAMLLPVLKKGVELSRPVACMNNLKQVSLAFTLYSDDYGQHYPPIQHLGSEGGPNLTWAGFLYSYLDISRPGDANKYGWYSYAQVYLCPAKGGKKLEWGASSYGMTSFNACVGSAHPCSNPYNCEMKHYWKSTELGGKTVLVADTGTQSNGIDLISVFRGALPKTRHLGRANFIRWDGTVLTREWPNLGLPSDPAIKYDTSGKLVEPSSGLRKDWLEKNW